MMPGIEQELTHEGAPEIAVGQFHQQQVAEIPDVAQKGQIVGALPLVLNLGGIAQPHLGLSDQVERGIGQRDIFFQHRRMAAPFRNPVAEDQRVVAHPQQELHQFVLVHIRHHICPASSGMSKNVGWR